jgi:hypothetical protein
MGIFSSIFSRYQKQIETAEGQTDEQLRTHYYKANFHKLFQSVEEMFRNDPNCRIISVSKEHGEIAVEVKSPLQSFLIATVISVKPLETAVDFNISSEKMSLTGLRPALRKQIAGYYNRLSKLHTYTGAGKNV